MTSGRTDARTQPRYPTRNHGEGRLHARCDSDDLRGVGSARAGECLRRGANGRRAGSNLPIGLAASNRRIASDGVPRSVAPTTLTPSGSRNRPPPRSRPRSPPAGRRQGRTDALGPVHGRRRWRALAGAPLGAEPPRRAGPRSAKSAQLQRGAACRPAAPAGCPPQSLIGRGHALAKALAGSRVIEEQVALWAFIGPPQGSNPTLELLGEGSTPVPASVVITGTVVPAHAPYGEQLVIPIPPVPSLPSVSETSLANLTLTIGTSGPHPARSANTVVGTHAAQPAAGRSPRRSPTPTAPPAAPSPSSPARRRSSDAPLAPNRVRRASTALPTPRPALQMPPALLTILGKRGARRPSPCTRAATCTSPANAASRSTSRARPRARSTARSTCA